MNDIDSAGRERKRDEDEGTTRRKEQQRGSCDEESENMKKM